LVEQILGKEVLSDLRFVAYPTPLIMKIEREKQSKQNIHSLD